MTCSPTVDFGRFLYRVFCRKCKKKKKKVKKFLFEENNLEKVHETDVSKMKKVDDTGSRDQEDAKKKKGKLMNLKG